MRPTPKPIGHADTMEALLSRPLDGMWAFVGPESVGKNLAAWHVAEQNVSTEVDLWGQGVGEISLPEFAGTSRFGTKLRVAVVDLTRSPAPDPDALLTISEDAPEHFRMIVVTTPQKLPPTLADRCHIATFGYLSSSEIAEILRERLRIRMTGADAERAGKAGGGLVSAALQFLRTEDERATVMRAVLSATYGDLETLETLSAKWTNQHTGLLVLWACEAVTHRPQMFTASDVAGDMHKLALRLLLRMPFPYPYAPMVPRHILPEAARAS